MGVYYQGQIRGEGSGSDEREGSLGSLAFPTLEELDRLIYAFKGINVSQPS